MVGGRPPCSNKAATSARRWWSHVLAQNHGNSAGRPFRVPEDVKMTSAKYVEFMADHFLPWYRRKNYAFHNKIIFMHYNAPSHAAKNTSASMAAMGIKRRESWCGLHPPPDLNPIENLWSILKQKIYEGGRQFTSKQQLWEAILTSCKQIQAETVQKHTSSMDARLVKLLSNKGSYVKM
ncbi:unnamed protein product [Staurois parvus]|uniref:Tc1-like transposase DDE domain-containing protein n=1 Tax=Staurois parvus TaxID=386267 RepID=A0ABN9GUP6_9NEOB|nr:unnamed protein product [Staurois parvus]